VWFCEGVEDWCWMMAEELPTTTATSGEVVEEQRNYLKEFPSLRKIISVSLLRKSFSVRLMENVLVK